MLHSPLPCHSEERRDEEPALRLLTLLAGFSLRSIEEAHEAPQLSKQQTQGMLFMPWACSGALTFPQKR
jgi:hypothetical protein